MRNAKLTLSKTGNKVSTTTSPTNVPINKRCCWGCWCLTERSVQQQRPRPFPAFGISLSPQCHRKTKPQADIMWTGSAQSCCRHSVFYNILLFFIYVENMFAVKQNKRSEDVPWCDTYVIINPLCVSYSSQALLLSLLTLDKKQGTLLTLTLSGRFRVTE